MTAAESPAAAPLTARAEWRTMWPLPVVAMLGMAATSMFSYSSGVFLNTVTAEFGWTKAQFSAGFTIQILLMLLVAPLIGRVIDRYGPRRMALAGIVPFVLAFAALGLANGSATQWALLCVAQGLTTAFLSPVIWLSAVVGRFNASRGMALAVVQSGHGVATALWPALAAYYLGSLGWRHAFGALALTWAVPMLPLILIFFYGAHDRRRGEPAKPVAAAAPRPALAPLLLTRTFICLTLAGGLFAVVSLGTMLHLVPLLQSSGFDLGTSASIASLAGIATLAGRLGTGVLLDRFPAKVIAIITFLVPILPAMMLWQGKGSLEMAAVAVCIFGFTAGAESDVVAYIASRLLPPAVFASGFAIILAGFAVFASMGPLIASRLFDVTGSYDAFLLLIVPLVVTGAGLIALIPRIAPSHAALSSETMT